MKSISIENMTAVHFINYYLSNFNNFPKKKAFLTLGRNFSFLRSSEQVSWYEYECEKEKRKIEKSIFYVPELFIVKGIHIFMLLAFLHFRLVLLIFFFGALRRASVSHI